MITELKGSLYYLFSNLRFSLLLFWGILIGVLALSVISALLIENSHVSFNLAFPTYIFAAIFGYWMVKNAIPYLIKMGATRKVIFIAIGIFGIVLSIFNSMISNAINNIILTLDHNGGLNSPLSISIDGNEQFINHIGQFIGHEGWFSRVIIDSSISFFLFGCLFICGLIFYRYGIVGGLGSFVIGILAIMYAGNVGWLESFIKFVFTDFNFVFFYQLFGVGIIIYVLSFLLLRRFTL